MTPPNTIEIKSDRNVLTLIEENKGMYTYKYTKSKTKKNQTLTLSENELVKLIKVNGS